MWELQELQWLMTKDYPNTIELIFMIDYLSKNNKGMTYDIFKSWLENKIRQSGEEVGNKINWLTK